MGERWVYQQKYTYGNSLNLCFGWNFRIVFLVAEMFCGLLSSDMYVRTLYIVHNITWVNIYYIYICDYVSPWKRRYRKYPGYFKEFALVKLFYMFCLLLLHGSRVLKWVAHMGRTWNEWRRHGEGLWTFWLYMFSRVGFACGESKCHWCVLNDKRFWQNKK